MTTTKTIKLALNAILLSLITISYSYATNSQFTASATVLGSDNIYCPQQNGSGGSADPGNCGTVNFGTYSGIQVQQQMVATVTTTDPTKDATLSVADPLGGNYVLRNTTTPTEQVPMAIQYTDCNNNTYGSTTTNTTITNADIIGSSINGATPACTSYNTYPATGTHGTFTFTLPSGTPPAAGTYQETLNVSIGSV